MDGIVRKQDANMLVLVLSDFNKHFICMNYAVRRVTADIYIYIVYSNGPKTAQSAAAYLFIPEIWYGRKVAKKFSCLFCG